MSDECRVSSVKAAGAAPDVPPLPPPHPLPRSTSFHQKLKDALVALSLANLCFIGAWFRLLYGHELGYFRKPVSEVSLLAMATNILWLGLVVWLVLQASRRFQSAWFHALCHFALFGLLLLPLDFARRQIFVLRLSTILHFVRQPIIGLGLAALGVVVIWQHRRVARALAILVGILAPLALFTFVRITLVSLNVAHLAEPTSEPALMPLSPVHPGQPRVIWIIFDEMDYRLAFEQRPAGLRLPEFDCVRGEALCATNAYPPADATLTSMPALISGKRLTNVTTVGISDLGVTLADTGHASLWSQLPSVFGSARQLGVNTAIIGWFHPYRRVLCRDLNYCEWYPYPKNFPQQQSSFSAALQGQIGCLFGDIQFARLYGRVCRTMVAKSVDLVTNADYGLILLHLPPPHHPGVFIPEKNSFSMMAQRTVPGYFNNLLLADRSLGKLRAALEASGQWEKTWIIVSADHSWRWSNLYDRRRDFRVPFLVKPSGQQTGGLNFPGQINTVLTHDLILAILGGEVTNGPATAHWLEARAGGALSVTGP